jgi:DNA/RNA-binding domain of Phe-tRNA-synthetase-like protein
VIFTDEKDVVIARRWCWRQSEESAAREETTDVLITIEAQMKAAENWSNLLRLTCVSFLRHILEEITHKPSCPETESLVLKFIQNNLRKGYPQSAML